MDKNERRRVMWLSRKKVRLGNKIVSIYLGRWYRCTFYFLGPAFKELKVASVLLSQHLLWVEVRIGMKE